MQRIFFSFQGEFQNFADRRKRIILDNVSAFSIWKNTINETSKVFKKSKERNHVFKFREKKGTTGEDIVKNVLFQFAR